MVSRTEEIAERRHAHSVDHARPEVEEDRALYELSARGLLVKHVDAAELRVVVAAELELELIQTQMAQKPIMREE